MCESSVECMAIQEALICRCQYPLKSTDGLQPKATARDAAELISIQRGTPHAHAETR